MNDEYYMSLALKLAENGVGRVSPNPLVGCVIVKGDKVIGSGYHKEYGGAHAEVNALNNCKESPEGATLYVNLEPCCHKGKQPPCTDAIINSKIKKVVVGSTDPNPLVANKGIILLRKSGIEVCENILKEESDELNEVFFHYIKNKSPYVLMKYAMSLDGKIATFTGDSKWITNEASRRNVHEDRNKYMAIMVGVGTVLKDNPKLTSRIKNGINPIRIICDSNLSTPLESEIVKSAKNVATIIATISKDEEKMKKYKSANCHILKVSEKDGKLNLKDLLKKLGELKIDSLIIEGGSTLNWSALESEIVNKIQVYIAPKLIGGEKAKSPIGGLGFSKIDESVKVKNWKTKHFGEDFLIEGEVCYVHRDN